MGPYYVTLPPCTPPSPCSLRPTPALPTHCRPNFPLISGSQDCEWQCRWAGANAPALRAAVLLRVSPTADLPEGVDCKSLGWPLENAPLLPVVLLELAEDLARRQGLHPGHILGHVLPQGLQPCTGATA